MKKITKYLTGILLSVLFLFANIDSLSASSASISVSGTSSVVLGNTFSITIKISSGDTLGAWDFTPSYDTGKFKLISGETSVADYGPASSKSYSYTFKAIGTGSGTISVKSYGAYDYDENKMSVSVSSKTVNVITQAQKKATYSNNNYIKEIYIDGHDGLTPSFDKNTTDYKIDVDTNVTKVNIVAITEDSKADLSGDGEHEVSEGENKFTITCTAQNGDDKNYYVIVNVVDPNPIEVTIDGEKYKVVKREAAIQAPDNYEKTTIKIDDQDVPALYNELNKYTLVSLKDTKGNASLFIYDKDNKTYTKYEEIKLSQMKIYPLSLDKTFGEKNPIEKININDALFEAIKLANKDFYIIHARDLETGEDDYYRYDIKTNTMIRYSDDTSSFKKEITEYKKLIMILGAETVIIIFVLICILIARMVKNRRRKKKIKEMKLKALQEEKEKELEKEEKTKVEEEEKITEEKVLEEKTEKLSKTAKLSKTNKINIDNAKTREYKKVDSKKKTSTKNKKKKEELNDEER